MAKYAKGEFVELIFHTLQECSDITHLEFEHKFSKYIKHEKRIYKKYVVENNI